MDAPRGINMGRLSVNLVSLLVTCVALSVAVKLSDSTGFVERIGKNLDAAMQDLIDDMPVYSNYTDDTVYVSSTRFNPKGMAGLYNLTTLVIDWIVPRDLWIKGLILIKDQRIQVNVQDVDYHNVLATYWGLLAVLAILVLMALLLPVCGLCFCCCRCCGKCGATSRPCDKKRDLCKKVFQGALLIALGTGLLFCVVCAFASNQQMQEGINTFPKNVNNSLKDANSFLDSTKKQAKLLLVDNYRQFSNMFGSTMNKSTGYVIDQLTIFSNATSIMVLYSFVDNIPAINESLKSLKQDTNSLRVYASQLNDAMRKVKKDLLTTLSDCRIERCVQIKNNISQLQTNIDFNKLPDVTPAINSLNELDLQDLNNSANSAKKELAKIEENIRVQMNTSIEEAVNRVNEAGTTISMQLGNITQQISNIQSSISNTLDPAMEELDGYIKDYGQYRYYVGLAVSCVLLLVTLFIALGLVCGICGKRPDGYSDNCCNKGAGSQFLICSVWIIFLSGFVIALIAFVTFVVGIASDRVVCQTLRNPENSSLMQNIEKFFNQSSTVKLSPTKVLISCRRNETIYDVFSLSEQLDLTELKKEFNISANLENLYSKLNDVGFGNVEILSNSSRKKLEKLKSFDPDINFEQYEEELKQNFTNLNLGEISLKLEELVKTIDGSPEFDEVKRQVQLSILNVNAYNDNLMEPMKKLALKVVDSASQLNSQLTMNYTNFTVAITELLAQIDDAQYQLNHNGKDLLVKIARQFGNVIENQVNSYIDRVISVVRMELGKCGPLNSALDGTLTATCDKVLLPWNGFWLSLLLSLLLFLPTIIVAVKLASLYQKYKQCGPYGEINDGHRNKNKKKTKKSKRYEERSQNIRGTDGAVARDYPASSHRVPDSRYSDTAPKHWEEFPNGGPPQYQRAPTEYERPPPYYYPGTGEQ